jgi:hypothetical protein
MVAIVILGHRELAHSYRRREFKAEVHSPDPKISTSTTDNYLEPVSHRRNRQQGEISVDDDIDHDDNVRRDRCKYSIITHITERRILIVPKSVVLDWLALENGNEEVEGVEDPANPQHDPDGPRARFLARTLSKQKQPHDKLG